MLGDLDVWTCSPMLHFVDMRCMICSFWILGIIVAKRWLECMKLNRNVRCLSCLSLPIIFQVSITTSWDREINSKLTYDKLLLYFSIPGIHYHYYKQHHNQHKESPFISLINLLTSLSALLSTYLLHVYKLIFLILQPILHMLWIYHIEVFVK